MKENYTNYPALIKGLILEGIIQKDKFIETYNDGFKNSTMPEELSDALLKQPLDWYFDESTVISNK